MRILVDIQFENARIQAAQSTETPAEELRELWEWATISDTIVREAVFHALLANDATPADLLFTLSSTLLPHHEDLAERILTHPNTSEAVWELVFTKDGFSHKQKKHAYRLIRTAL